MTLVKINAIDVPADSGDELAHRFAARAGAVDDQDGFEGFELLKPTDERTTWLVVIVMLTLATLRLPSAYTALFFVVDVALLLVFLGVNEGSTGLLKAGGYAVFVFTAIGVYLFFGAASLATGGPAMPLGKPLLRG